MLKKRFLLRRLLSVPGCVLSSAEKHCTEQHSDAGKIPSTNHASQWYRGTPTVSAKRPAGITVHASMLKKRFLLRRLLSVPGCVLSSAENTAQNSIAMPARYPRHASKWHCGTPTVSTKRPAGITVHASMLKKRFLLRRLPSVPGCVLSSAEQHCTEQHSDAGKIPSTNQVSGTVAPRLFQRNGPLESQCTQACSKSGSFCADCCLCLAACCQALKTLHRTA